MINIENLSVGYGKEFIINDLSLRIEKGENLAIIGRNGCGKTTLLRAVAGTLEFTGSILIDGENITKLKRERLARRVAMLSQSTSVYFNYTVEETVSMGRYSHEAGNIFARPDENSRASVEAALKQTGLYEMRNKGVDTLSGGQLQRVFLAKILAQDPEILLLDEPTNHLDLNYQLEMLSFLKTWSKERGKTIIGVLHDINLTLYFADNVLLLDNGNIVSYGSAKKVLSSDKINEIYGINISKYMLQSLERWKNIEEES